MMFLAGKGYVFRIALFQAAQSGRSCHVSFDSRIDLDLRAVAAAIVNSVTTSFI
jgi:hypothetical protein